MSLSQTVSWAQRVDLLSALYNFLVPCFHTFESNVLSKEFLGMDFHHISVLACVCACLFVCSACCACLSACLSACLLIGWLGAAALCASIVLVCARLFLSLLCLVRLFVCLSVLRLKKGLIPWFYAFYVLYWVVCSSFEDGFSLAYRFDRGPPNKWW